MNMTYTVFEENVVSGVRRPDYNSINDDRIFDTIEEAQAWADQKNQNKDFCKLYQIKFVPGPCTEVDKFMYMYDKCHTRRWTDAYYTFYVKNFKTGALKRVKSIMPEISAKRAYAQCKELNHKYENTLKAHNCAYIYQEDVERLDWSADVEWAWMSDNNKN